MNKIVFLFTCFKAYFINCLNLRKFAYSLFCVCVDGDDAADPVPAHVHCPGHSAQQPRLQLHQGPA